ncbi:hypothetical protein GC173_02925 [bacterium]|nr:hypothetical protein [bacterium]
MRAVSKENFAKGGIAAAVICGGLALPMPANAQAPTTARMVVEEMPVRERTSYIAGVVDGLAYARFRKDTLTKGEKDESGMKCILEWFRADSLAKLQRIEATFKKYGDEYPPILLTLMVKKECGE